MKVVLIVEEDGEVSSQLLPMILEQVEKLKVTTTDTVVAVC